MGIKFIAMCVQPGVYTRFNALVRQTIVLIQLNAADLKRISFCASRLKLSEFKSLTPVGLPPLPTKSLHDHFP
jgi:hypothetical protein